MKNKPCTTHIAQISVISSLICLLFLGSCKKEDEQIVKTETNESNQSTEGMTKLGKKLDNPYSVENMKKAYSNLSSKAKLSEDFNQVRATHLYVRFLPDTWEQYDVLIRDTSLTLYNTPLDYELEPGLVQYHEPSIPIDKPTWQYTSVPVDFKFDPEIKYEILEECYIPEYDDSFTQKARKARSNAQGKNVLDQLVDQAMIVSGNESDTLKPKSSAKLAWQPRGRVRSLDTRLNSMIGLQGVKIIVRRWILVKVREATTNFDGNYWLEDFNRPVNYSCVFETGEYDIRSDTWGQVKFDGPKSSSEWNLDFWADDLNRFYCDVFRGAYRYHYGNMGGLRRPDIDAKLKYSCYDKSHKEDANGVFWSNWDPTGAFPDLTIYRFANDIQRTSDQVFSTTIHETAHASHAKLVRSKTNNTLRIVENRIVESWAVGVQWMITRMEYLERGLRNPDGTLADYAGPNYTIAGMPERLRLQHQAWRNDQTGGDYSSLFIDLVDNFDQSVSGYSRIVNGVTVNYLGHNDPVSGYTLPFIEQNILAESHSKVLLNSWLHIYRPSGVSFEQLNILMNNY